jgi:Pyruvate/2-oxoacid:ferredoxin oxidoreductase gamma subunit
MSEPEEQPKDDTGHAAKAAAILGVAFALIALQTHGPRVAVSVLVGAAVAVANLVTMRAIIRALVQGASTPF